MHEIKFRGKRVDNGEWVYGYYFYSQVDDVHYIKGGNRVYGFTDHEYIVDPATVGQFSTLRDKNGREIYEGDILRIKGEPPWTFDYPREVKFIDGVFGVRNQTLDKHDPLGARVAALVYEVIGNIHDNPELLNG